jgi:uncharacterized protein (TIGR02246 family)
MPETPSPQADELRLRARFFRIGCVMNVVVFTVLIAVMVVYLIQAARTIDLTPSSGESPSRGTQADDAAIRGVLNNQVAAWNKGDLDAFMDGYWKDDKLTFTSGDKVDEGWEATRDSYIERYKSKGKEMGKLAFEKLQVESLSPDVALVRGRFVLALKDGPRSGRFTLTFRKFPDGWKITSDHTSAKEKDEKK